MYDMPGIPKLTASLNNVSYTWVRVYYFKVGTSSTEEGEGWVAEKYTTIVSTTAPTKSDTISSNSYLKQNQQLTNARYIYNYLKNAGWSNNAIYAVLGNMEEESTINPGKTEVNSSNPGYGLTQWTPSTKLTNRATNNGYNAADIDTQLMRIIYEAANKEQWNATLHSPTICDALSFVKKSTS